jgi:hypothetical protein
VAGVVADLPVDAGTPVGMHQVVAVIKPPAGAEADGSDELGPSRDAKLT